MVDKLGPLFAASPQLRDIFGSVFQGMFDKHNENVYTKRRVGDILFNGYRVNFFEDIEAMGKQFPAAPIRSPLPNNTFGIMYGKNRTSPGLFSLDTGELEVMNLKKVKSFRDRARVPHWTADTCNMINGTDGSAFHPQIQRKESLYIFNVDICRYDHSLTRLRDCRGNCLPHPFLCLLFVPLFLCFFLFYLTSPSCAVAT